MGKDIRIVTSHTTVARFEWKWNADTPSFCAVTDTSSHLDYQKCTMKQHIFFYENVSNITYQSQSNNRLDEYLKPLLVLALNFMMNRGIIRI